MKRNIKRTTIGITVIVIALILHGAKDYVPKLVSTVIDPESETYMIAMHTFLMGQVMFYYLVISIFILDFNFLKTFRKEPRKIRIDTWLSTLHTDDDFSLEVKTMGRMLNKHDNDIEQLNTLKKMILDYCKHNKENLYLFRSFYKSKLEQNNKPIWITIFSPIILSIPFLIRQKLLGEEILIYGAELSIFHLLFFAGIGITLIYRLIIEDYKSYSTIYHTTDAIIQNTEAREANGEIVDLEPNYLKELKSKLKEKEPQEVYLSNQKRKE